VTTVLLEQSLERHFQVLSDLIQDRFASTIVVDQAKDSLARANNHARLAREELQDAQEENQRLRASLAEAQERLAAAELRGTELEARPAPEPANNAVSQGISEYINRVTSTPRKIAEFKSTAHSKCVEGLPGIEPGTESSWTNYPYHKAARTYIGVLSDPTSVSFRDLEKQLSHLANIIDHISAGHAVQYERLAHVAITTYFSLYASIRDFYLGRYYSLYRQDSAAEIKGRVEDIDALRPRESFKKVGKLLKELPAKPPTKQHGGGSSSRTPKQFDRSSPSQPPKQPPSSATAGSSKPN
jgi:hypothetical protein